MGRGKFSYGQSEVDDLVYVSHIIFLEIQYKTKWTKDFNENLTKEHIQITIKHVAKVKIIELARI